MTGIDLSVVSTKSLHRTVNAGFTAAVLLLLLIGGVSYWSVTAFLRAASDRRHSYELRGRIASVLVHLQDAETGQRGYLLTGSAPYLEPYRHGVAAVQDDLTVLQRLGAGDSVIARELERLRPLVAAKVVELSRTIDLREQNGLAAALRVVDGGSGLVLMDSLRSALGRLSDTEGVRTARSDARLEAAGRIARVTIVGGALLAIVIVTIAGLLFRRDVAARAEAEEEVRRSQNFLDSIIEQLPHMVFIKDAADLRFVRFNRAGEELLGYSRDELMGKNDFDFFPNAEAQFFVSKDREVLAGGTVADIPTEEIHTRHKGTRILHTKKVPVLDLVGQPRFLLGVSEDITERVRAEEELRRARAAAETANHAKSEFLAKMSHELRTPLNSIIGFSEMLDDQTFGPLNQKQRRYVDNVLTSGRQLLDLINDILDLAKVEAGRMELVPTPFVVADALEDIRTRMESLARHKQHTIDVEVAPGLPTLTADPGRFRQIMDNLLSNAIKFTPNGGQIHVVARRAPAGDGIELVVSDTGIGIKPEDQGRIFQEFEQLDNAYVREQQGTGLGLALTRKLVELHGGRIDVESQPGQGSTFRFVLPFEARQSGRIAFVDAVRQAVGPRAAGHTPTMPVEGASR